jgi:hypothetical protein
MRELTGREKTTAWLAVAVLLLSNALHDFTHGNASQFAEAFFLSVSIVLLVAVMAVSVTPPLGVYVLSIRSLFQSRRHAKPDSQSSPRL